MPDFERLRTDSGDERLDQQSRGGASMPGTPGYESEAAYRHRISAEVDMPELNANQLAPMPLQEATEENTTPTIEQNTLNFEEGDQHDSR